MIYLAFRFACSQTRKRMNNFTYFVCLFIYLFIYFFIYFFIDSFIHLFIRLFIHSFVRSSIHPFINSFIHSFIHSFIRSFIHLCVDTSVSLIYSWWFQSSFQPPYQSIDWSATILHEFLKRKITNSKLKGRKTIFVIRLIEALLSIEHDEYLNDMGGSAKCSLIDANIIREPVTGHHK